MASGTPVGDPWLVRQAERHLVFARWRTGQVKLCTVQFAKKGIFVHFPFHPDVPGLLAVGRPDSKALVPVRMFEDGTATLLHRIALNKEAAVTSHRVKFSHHVDGNCHFSQDGKIRTQIRNTSARLDGGSVGHLFSIDVEGPEHFAEARTDDLGDARYAPAPVLFDLPGAPRALHIAAYWFKLPPDAKPLGQLRNHIQFNDPEEELGWLWAWAMAPPVGSPFDAYVLAMTHEAMSPISSGDLPPFLMLFSGAFVGDPEDLSAPESFLVLQYPGPTKSPLPSVDLPT
jgi:hypothetical protein